MLPFVVAAALFALGQSPASSWLPRDPAPPPAIDAVRVVRERTPIGDLELAAVLRDAHHAVFGTEPTMRRLAVAWAQARTEGSRASVCHNLGSIGLAPRRGGPYFVVGGARFIASADFLDGAERYWSTIRQSYSGTLAWFDAGDPDTVARRLGRAGYHRSDADVYARMMRSLYAEFWHTVAPRL